MQARAASRVAGEFVCIAAAAGVLAATPGIAAPLAGPPLAPRSHGFMLYLSQPLGGGSGGGGLHPKFGFRIEQVRMMGNSGAPDAGDPFQHRALVGWQMDGLHGMHAANMKFELGGHMTYDVTHGAFAAQFSRHSTNPGARPATLNRPDSSPEPQSFAPHFLQLRPLEPSYGAREPFRMGAESPSMVHDIAAAVMGARAAHAAGRDVIAGVMAHTDRSRSQPNRP